MGADDTDKSNLTPPMNGINMEGSTSSHVDSMGLSWPSKGAHVRLNESQADREKRELKIAESVKNILECLGEDPEREGIQKTPLRYAKALMYLTRGC